MATSLPDFTAIKQRQQRVWSEGDFSLVAIPIVVVSENLCEAVDLRAGEQVLDVACGSGNTAIAAARRNTIVTGIDYVPALLDRAWSVPRRSGSISSSKRATPKLSVFRTMPSMSCFQHSASCSHPTTARLQPSCCGSAGPVAVSDSRTGHPRGRSGICFAISPRFPLRHPV